MSAAHDAGPTQAEAPIQGTASEKNGTTTQPPRPSSDAEEEDQEDEDEPRLKYNKLTATLSSVYRNGDDTSTFLVAGDKIVVGTHNGNIHVLSLPSLQSLRTYHAHSASVTALSISPIPPVPTLAAKVDGGARLVPDSDSSKATQAKATHPGSSQTTPKKAPVPNILSNQIHIASASVDGHVCVSSLVEAKDVTLRNFARPVQAVALSPEYKYDRTYLSGGLAGSLILTVGGKAGVSSDASTNGAAAAAQGWLGSIGLAANTGKDTVLHSGEGSISTIKFSRTSKYVAWINEHGIKIMRSHMKLDSADLHFAWKRIAHIDRPNRKNWEDMAAVWKGRMEWVNDRHVEADEDPTGAVTSIVARPGKASAQKRKPEKLVVGWGDTAWVLHVHPGGPGVGKQVGERTAGSADIVHKLSFDDCIISGLSLYTPSLLAVLAYRTRDDDDKPITAAQPGKSRRHRQNALSPELRLVEVATGEEVDVDTLTVSRFESLSVTDYHLGTIYIPTPAVIRPSQKGTLESLGAGFWDVGNSATRLFSSAASVNSATLGREKPQSSKLSQSSSALTVPGNGAVKAVQDGPQGLREPGLKIFIQTPYDCILAVKRDMADHLSWLLEHQKYAAAWNLLDEQPSIITSDNSRSIETRSTDSPKRAGSLADFFADDSASQTTLSTAKAQNSAVAKEKRRIGDLWLQQLVNAKEWTKAGQTAGKVLGNSTRWEHWVLAFAQAERFDEITPYIPSTDMRPPLPSFVYEVVLGHYITHDPRRFSQLLDRWDPELFDMTSVVNAIETRLAGGDDDGDDNQLGPDGEAATDWRMLMFGLAKLKLASGQAREALRCYIQLHEHDAAMDLVREYNLIDAVADDVPGLLMLRVTREQLESGSLAELREASAEGMALLVDEAYNGIVQPASVVAQLTAHSPRYDPLLYLYFARLWHGPAARDADDETRVINKVERLNLERRTNEGRIMVEGHADLALTLFARYDPPLLSLYLRTSTAYSLDTAVQLCEQQGKQLTADLVYLLSKTGETRRALFLIIDELHDVSGAIAFARERPDLWEDLLDYGMDKPAFIRALLVEVGGAGAGSQQSSASGGGAARGGLDAVALVRRIPSGLEVPGLKDAVQSMVREWDVQFSISEGVARVLRGEVAAGMEVLREGRRKGVKFDVRHPRAKEGVEVKINPALNAVDEGAKKQAGLAEERVEVTDTVEEYKPGHCVGCDSLFEEEEPDFLIGFACGHVFHLDCLLDHIKASKDAYALIDSLRGDTRLDPDDAAASSTLAAGAPMSVGAKISHAQIIRSAIGGGCPVCVRTVDGRV